MIKTGQELAAAAEAVAKNYKTLYVMGCFGAPLNRANKSRYTKNHPYNAKVVRSAKIKAASDDTFGFDCSGLIKGLLWGWEGDTGKTYGGAKYASRKVPDLSANAMIRSCDPRTTDFASLQTGEVLWTEGHVGIYIGNGLAVEATPEWKDGVQITAVLNIGSKAGYRGRRWTMHGRLPFVTYGTKTVDELAREVIEGKWGNGASRKRRLNAAGYDAKAVQQRVNALVKN